MVHRTILSLVAAFALFGSSVVSGFWDANALSAIAHGAQRCEEQTVDGPFMGMADPDAPYDLRFIDEMVMHHQGAIISSEMMIAGSERPELRDLAGRIQGRVASRRVSSARSTRCSTGVTCGIPPRTRRRWAWT